MREETARAPRPWLGVNLAPRITALLREHRLFAIALSLGAVLRVITQFAYRPALIVLRDTLQYLESARLLEPHPVRPFGYSAFLRLLPIENELAVVAVVQHGMGLAMAVALYVLLVRLGVRRGIATLATLPVLFDPMQLNLEQQVLAEAMFEALVVAGIVALLWQRRPTWVLAATAGLFFAGAVLTRSNGLLIILPAILVLLFLRARVVAVAALIGAFVLPLFAYALWFENHHGERALTESSGRFVYGRAASFVDCDRLEMPDYERQLCPKEPLGQRYSAQTYIWGKKKGSPHYSAVAPPGKTVDEIESSFAKRVFKAQPLDLVYATGRDFMRGFAWHRDAEPGDPSADRWKFQPTYPKDGYYRLLRAAIRAHGDEGGYADPQLAGFLTAYQGIVKTPGPLLFLAGLSGLAAFAGFGRAKHSGLRTAAALFPAMTVAYLLPAAAIAFSWRYQLMQLVLLPPAAAIAYTAFTAREQPTDAQPREATPGDAEPATTEAAPAT